MEWSKQIAERTWMLMNLALVYGDEGLTWSRSMMRRRERAQGTVEYGAALLGIAAAAIALWLLLGPAIAQLGQRMVAEVNNVK